MRTLIITPDYPPTLGGIQRLLHSMASNMQSTEIRVLTIRRSESEPNSVDGIPVVRLRIFGKRPWVRSICFNIVVAFWRTKGWKPDVILNGHVTTIFAALALRVRMRRPVATYAYGKEILGRPGLTRFSARTSSAVIAISRYTAGLVEEACSGRLDRSKVFIIHPGTVAPTMPGCADAPRPTIVTVSRLRDYYKGHDKLMRSLLLVLPEYPDLDWVVVGDGPIRRELEDDAVRLGLGGNCRFVGEIPDRDVEAIFSRAHIFCMPARYPEGEVAGEGFAIVYAEAGGWGIPCIAGNVGGPREAVKDGVTGLLVDPESERDIADAILYLLDHPDEAQRLGRSGRERACNDLAWPTVASQLESALQTCAASTRRN